MNLIKNVMLTNVITIQSITMYRFDNLDRPTQAQIFYNKSKIYKKKLPILRIKR